MNRPGDALQWAVEMFGSIARNRRERALRFLEEAIELAQVEGVEEGIVASVLQRVYSRAPGDLAKEIGQAAMCLEVLAWNAGLNADAEAAREFSRVQTIPKSEWARRHDAKVALGIASN